MSGMKRVSLSLPESLVDDLDYISHRLGVSRSGFIASMLQQADMRSLRALVSHIPEQPTDDDVKRFRGSSQAYFDEQLQRLQQLQGGLFDDPTE
jgi:hypothetical protein